MIHTSDLPDVAVPRVAMTPWLLDRAKGRGNKPALIDAATGRTLTYAQWIEGVNRVAGSLQRKGFQKGDVGAIFACNSPDFAILFHAISLLGGIVTTANPMYTGEELRKQLDDCRPKILFTTASFVDKARQANVDEMFVLGENFEELLAGDGEPQKPDIDSENDLIALPYSSGTTGLPKGVMLTHHNLITNVLQIQAAVSQREDDVILGVLPFFHIYGMNLIMNLGLYTGATIVTLPRFELEPCLAAMQKYRVTYAYIVPPIALALARNPKVGEYDLSSVRTLFCGAAPLSREIASEATSRLGCTIVEGYGMTEASPATHATLEGRHVGVGKTLPNTESKIADVMTGKDLGLNEEGEVCVRGPQVMKGYLNRPDATRQIIDDDGWLHTGDIGYADAEGNFFVVDRVKELIKYKGMQIAPAELEALLLTHPAVADAAVVGIKDDEAGQVPKAFVVLRPEARNELMSPDATAGDANCSDAICAEIKLWIAARVAPYKKLREVTIIDSIPKSPSGKILRRMLAAR